MLYEAAPAPFAPVPLRAGAACYVPHPRPCPLADAVMCDEDVCDDDDDDAPPPPPMAAGLLADYVVNNMEYDNSIVQQIMHVRVASSVIRCLPHVDIDPARQTVRVMVDFLAHHSVLTPALAAAAGALFVRLLTERPDVYIAPTQLVPVWAVCFYFAEQCIEDDCHDRKSFAAAGGGMDRRQFGDLASDIWALLGYNVLARTVTYDHMLAFYQLVQAQGQDAARHWD